MNLEFGSQTQEKAGAAAFREGLRFLTAPQHSSVTDQIKKSTEPPAVKYRSNGILATAPVGKCEF